jgi:hypothetical protein
MAIDENVPSSHAPKRKPSPDLSGEGLVELSLGTYFLQHLPGQHFALLLQQSTTGDEAVAVPINVAKVAIQKRYFIDPSFCLIEELGHEFRSRRADGHENTLRGGGTSGR